MKPAHLKGNEKACKVCGHVKTMDEFPKRGHRRLNSCEPCYKEYENRRSRERYRNDPEYRKNKTLWQKARIKSRYGITVEEAQETLVKQNFRCANLECQTQISLSEPERFEKKAVIDHDHTTGKFRQLLCQRCNLILGYLETRPKIISGLDQYITKHST